MNDEQPMHAYRWRAHPAREHAGKALVAALLVGAIAVLAGLLMDSVWWGCGAFLAMLAALNRFFLPTGFAIDDEGITARYPFRRQRFRWSDLRRFAVDDHGGYLSTRARRSWLDAYRGMHVLFGAQRDAVVERIRRQLREGGGSWAS